MATFADDIIEAANGETIEAVVIGEMGWGDYGAENVPSYAQQPKGKVLTWDEAKPWLNYDYDRDYGAPECNAVYVWTTTRVLFVVQYDGSTSISSVPRNPSDDMPDMPGG